MNVFEKLGGWTLGKKYDEGTLTSIEVNPDQIVTLGLDYGKTMQSFKYDETHQQWRKLPHQYSNQAILNTKVLSLPFNKRSSNVLRAIEVRTVRQLTEMTEDDFLKYRNCGRLTIRNIKETLSEYGLQLKPIKKRV